MCDAAGHPADRAGGPPGAIGEARAAGYPAAGCCGMPFAGGVLSAPVTAPWENRESSCSPSA